MNAFEIPVGDEQASEMPTVTEHEDTVRLDYLERLLWSDHVGNGVALMPAIKCRPFLVGTSERFVTVSDMGDEDGSSLAEELSHSKHTLREALDDLRSRFPVPAEGEPQ